MTEKDFDDQMLSRWLDGELEPAETERLRKRLGAERELAVRLSQFRKGDDAVRDWYDSQLAPAPRALEDVVRQSFKAKRSKRLNVSTWLPAAAAAAVVLAGFVGFDYMIDRRVNAALDLMQAQRASDAAFLTASMQEVLETRPSGEAVQVQNASTGLNVTLVARRTWKSATGHWCREFVESFEGERAAEQPVSTACRSRQGIWERVRTEIPSPSTPIIPVRAPEQSL